MRVGGYGRYTYGRGRYGKRSRFLFSAAVQAVSKVVFIAAPPNWLPAPPLVADWARKTPDPSTWTPVED